MNTYMHNGNVNQSLIVNDLEPTWMENPLKNLNFSTKLLLL